MKSNDVTFAFVGDMSFGDSLFCQGYGVRTIKRQKGGEYLFSDVTDILKKNDIVFGNLETVLSRYGEDSNRLTSVDMRGDPENAYALKKTGFNVLNMANNHAMQHGLQPFLETVNLLHSLNIKVVGRKSTDQMHSEPVVLEKNRVKVGFLGYAFEKDRYYFEEIPYAYGIEDLIEKDIKMLRPNVAVLIVSNHWGLERMDYPSRDTIIRARTMVDLGADIVIGHHPHVLQGIERYKGKIIAYSLGNFIFDMMWDKRYRESMILEISCGLGQEMSYNIIPVKIDLSYRPYLLNWDEERELMVHIQNLSLKINREIEEDRKYCYIRYNKEFDRLNRKAKMNSYRYFISNFWRYEKKYLLQQLAMTIKSRLEDMK